MGVPVEGRFEIGTDGPSLVLVGIDGSRTSLRAAAWAAGLVRRQGSRLVVVHVQRPSATLAMSNAEIAADLEREFRVRVVEMGIQADFVSVVGDPWHELTRIADEMRVDLVVVGASESAGHRIVGSLTGRLVRAGRWPVSVVP
jgi:nucleotide-binding universal stress UspA family protein